MALTKIGIDAIEGAIGTAQLEDNAVTTGKIAAGAVGTTDLADTSVTVDKVANTAVTTDKLANTAVTVAKLADTLDLSTKTVTLASNTQGLGMSITSLAYPGDDTAVDTSSPGTVTIIGTGFEAGTLVYVDSVSNANSASSVVISGTTQITFTPPAKAAATYNVWLVGPTGRIAILANGIQYSGTPSWSGQSTSLDSGTAVNIQLSASGDTPLVYSLVSGTLPTGVTLSSTGLISGTVTGLESNTTFTNIVVKAQDPQNQDASVTLNLTITVTHQISRSLRFNSVDSHRLNKTPASEGDRQKHTLSVWLKRGKLGQEATIFEAGVSGTTNQYNLIWFDSNDRIHLPTDRGSGGTPAAGGYSLTCTKVFRDTSAWYHLVFAFDTTQATESNRIKIYLNGSRIDPSFFTGTYPAINHLSYVSDDVPHTIGNRVGSNAYFDGYMAEINFVDGQQLTPDSFGEIDGDTGVWVPISYAGSYGTNGFYLNFSDNSSVSALGTDTSGRGNNWTPSGFSVTTDSDSVVDSPTQYGTDTGVGGEVRGNYATINPADVNAGSSVALSNGNLYYVVTSSSAHGMRRSTMSVSSGKWYAECTIVNATAGTDRVGIISDSQVGYTTTANPYIGYFSDGYAYMSNGSMSYKENNGTQLSYGDPYSTNDVIGIALDMDAGTLTFYKNGVSQGQAYSGLTGSFCFSGSPYNNGAHYWNFGQRPFAHAAPSGFKCVTVQNLAEPTIADASDHFTATTYTGTDTTGLVVTTGMEPGLVWIKDRQDPNHHTIFDSVRGANKSLASSLANAEVTPNAGTGLLSFDSTGFTLGTETSATGSTNASSRSYISWNWKTSSSTVTNNAGSIESQVRANATAGISVVTYTTQSSGTATVGHGLGVAPSVIFVKPRNAVFQWDVYHSGIGKDAYLVLNTTAAQSTGATTVWNSVAPTSTVFSLGSAWASAAPGALTVAYCFAEVPGFSKFGTYTGNGSTDGPFVYTGFRPAFVLVKNVLDTGTDWQLHDTTRSPLNVVSNRLQPNINAAETTNYDLGDILSNGFKVRQTNNSWNGSNMIYLAFAENPFKYAVAR